MTILSWLFLAACIALACAIFNAKRSDFWGLKGVLAGTGAFALVMWGIPFLWGLAKLVAVVAILGALAGIAYLVFKAVAKHA
jgi:hypothetical protein